MKKSIYKVPPLFSKTHSAYVNIFFSKRRPPGAGWGNIRDIIGEAPRPERKCIHFRMYAFLGHHNKKRFLIYGRPLLFYFAAYYVPIIITDIWHFT